MYWGGSKCHSTYGREEHPIVLREKLSNIPSGLVFLGLIFFLSQIWKKIQMATINSKVLRDLTELYDQKKV